MFAHSDEYVVRLASASNFFEEVPIPRDVWEPVVGQVLNLNNRNHR